MEEQKASEKQTGGNHYKKMIIQPIEFITKNNIGYCEGNVIKYVCRWRKKNGLQDLEKAKHYIELLIEFSEKSLHRFLDKDILENNIKKLQKAIKEGTEI